MKEKIELVFMEYKKREGTIQRGILSNENSEWITEQLMLKQLTDEKLSEMWESVDDYFTKIRLDENGENWRSDIPAKEFMFYSDTWSAWLEVINREARRRKKEKVL